MREAKRSILGIKSIFLHACGNSCLLSVRLVLRLHFLDSKLVSVFSFPGTRAIVSQMRFEMHQSQIVLTRL